MKGEESREGNEGKATGAWKEKGTGSPLWSSRTSSCRGRTSREQKLGFTHRTRTQDLDADSNRQPLRLLQLGHSHFGLRISLALASRHRLSLSLSILNLFSSFNTPFDSLRGAGDGWRLGKVIGSDLMELGWTRGGVGLRQGHALGEGQHFSRLSSSPHTIFASHPRFPTILDSHPGSPHQPRLSPSFPYLSGHSRTVSFWGSSWTWT